jgi:flagellar hook protein FlgE
MFSGLSGLRNHQTALDVIGNNISNVNTVGYKGSRIQFSELLSQTIRGASSPVDNGLGGTNSVQVGLGIATASIDVSHAQGNLQSTGNMSDIAIQGNGFFILSNGQQNTYSRAGEFSFDANGTMVAANGMTVQGWMGDSTGTINNNGNIENISIPVGKTIAARATTGVDYAHNLSSTSDTLGTPHLAAGNSSNVERVYGTYTGNANAVNADVPPTLFPIDDVKGSHYIAVNAESHTGGRNDLNGTESMTSLGITDTSTFRVIVDGVSSKVTLANGLTSTVNELVSAINSQVHGVTAELTGNAVKLTRNVAGVNSTVAVEDIGLASNGIAANVFGTGGGKWAIHAKTVGTKTGLALTDALTGLGANNLVLTVNGTSYAFDPSTAIPPVTAASTVQQLITAFNTFTAAIPALGVGANAVTMGLNASGSLYVADNSHDTAGWTQIADAAPGAGTGIADLFFSTGGNWPADPVQNYGKTSIAANVTHEFVEADGGGIHYVPLSFSNGDAQITGLDGMNIAASASGFKAGTMVIQTVKPAEHVATTQVYDSLGKAHTIDITLTRIANNSWSWTAGGIDTVGSGNLTFDANGVIQSGAVNGNITVGASGGADSISLVPNFTMVTQYASPSTMLHISQDGYTDGALSTYSIDSNGAILGIYTNGLNQPIGQIAVAAFNNPAGLLKVSDSMFISSNNSGAAQVGAANTGGRGALSAGTLEMSNVDVAQEFANMIIYERGFQANSKVITTGDDMLQTLVSMKR